MMYTQDQIIEKYKKLALSLKVEFNTPVAINGRLTRTLGRVISDIIDEQLFPRRIEISRQLLQTATKESIDKVLIHEFCHWYLAETTHEDHGHDATFKELCQKLGGGDGKTTTHVDYLVKKEAIYKYQCFCENCGKEVAHYSRSCPTVKNPHLYLTNCCNSSLKVIQNW